MVYDVAVIGAGPAGVTAAIYAKRYMLDTVVISRDLGGMAKKAWKIENYPSHRSILGSSLAKLFQENFDHLEVPFEKDTVQKLEKGENFVMTTKDGRMIEARSVILASGTRKRRLGLPDEDRLKGISYCAICDAPFYARKTVAVIGGCDSGATTALLLAEYAEKVYLIEVKDKLPCEAVWAEQVISNPRIEVMCDSSAEALHGDRRIEAVSLKGGNKLDIQGLFIEIGSDPDNALARSLGVDTDDCGMIVVDRAQNTSIQGVFAAGDITDGSSGLRQISTAVGEGAVAAYSAYRYIRKR
jgi:thioredoxin reductase (NADPH)